MSIKNTNPSTGTWNRIVNPSELDSLSPKAVAVFVAISDMVIDIAYSR